MAQTSANAFDRFNDALRNLDDQIQDLRDRVDQRRHQVEKRARKLRADLEKRVRQSPLYRRAEQVRKDLDRQVEDARSQVLGAFGLATQADIERLNRKLNAISKRVSEIQKQTERRPTV
ncbi:MAG: hypothetical protein ACE5IL_13285 [Myxococcota bacterium]